MASAIQPTPLSSYVGFDSLPGQIEQKLLKRGFQFNVMVVGQTGLGKSTLINTLFASHLIESKGRLEAYETPRSTTEIHPVSHCECSTCCRERKNVWCSLSFLFFHSFWSQ